MSATLQALGRTLQQIGGLEGPAAARSGHRARALMLAGALAIAAAAPAHAQLFQSQPSGQMVTSSASAGYGQAPQNTAAAGQQQGTIVYADDSATRTTGKVVGGILGFAATALATKNTVARVLGTGVGALVGGAVANNSIANDQPQRRALELQRLHEAPATNSITRFAVEGSGAAPVGFAPSAASVPAGVKALPEPLRARLSALVVDSAARRVAAQHQLEKLDVAELNAATAPHDAEARAALDAVRTKYQAKLTDLTLSLNDLNSALGVVASKGFDVRLYSQAEAELVTKMEANAPVTVTSPVVLAKVAELEAEPASAVNKVASTYGDISQRKAAATHVAQNSMRHGG
jgi:hypothetical protein